MLLLIQYRWVFVSSDSCLDPTALMSFSDRENSKWHLSEQEQERRRKIYWDVRFYDTILVSS